MSNKVTILKVHKHAYRVNGHLIEQDTRTGNWYSKDYISVSATHHFYKFLQYGALNKNKLEAKRQRLLDQKHQLLNQLIQLELTKPTAQITQLKQIKLATILEKLAELNYNVTVYK